MAFFNFHYVFVHFVNVFVDMWGPHNCHGMRHVARVRGQLLGAGSLLPAYGP